MKLFLRYIRKYKFKINLVRRKPFTPVQAVDSPYKFFETEEGHLVCIETYNINKKPHNYIRIVTGPHISFSKVSDFSLDIKLYPLIQTK